jgi:hypothetical protein
MPDLTYSTAFHAACCLSSSCARSVRLSRKLRRRPDRRCCARPSRPARGAASGWRRKRGSRAPAASRGERQERGSARRCGACLGRRSRHDDHVGARGAASGEAAGPCGRGAEAGARGERSGSRAGASAKRGSRGGHPSGDGR